MRLLSPNLIFRGRDHVSSCARSMSAALVVGLCAVQAGALVVDFESIPASSAGTQLGTTVTTQGFTFTQFQGSNRIFSTDSTNPGLAANGTQYILDDTSPGSHFFITESSGAAFDLLSFDAAEAFAQPQQQTQNAVGIGLQANQVGGNVLQAQFLLDGVIDGPGGVADFETFTLPATWVNLTSVHIAWASLPNQNPISVFAIDNFNVIVPEPVTATLICAGVLILSRRRFHRV